GDEAADGDLRDVWCDASDSEQVSSDGGGSHESGSGAEEAWSEGEERGGAEDYSALEASILTGEGCGALEDPV
ncbi:MAG: hypothetical protein GY847_04555, partial [Proteobacteria bacterium]|nr:hypothetical protein [Pseudomonadota bacterium]